MNIYIRVTGKVATLSELAFLTCGNSGQMITFSFDEEWSEIADKTARFTFVREGKWQYIDREFTGDTVEVPILYDISEVEIGVYGGTLKTSTPARVPCRRSILCGNRTPEDPTPDVYAKIMEKLEGKVIKTIEVVDSTLMITFTDGTVYESESLKGDQGDPGAAGYTPQRGVDYWTEADIAEIKSYVDEAILGGAW